MARAQHWPGSGNPNPGYTPPSNIPNGSSSDPALGTSAPTNPLSEMEAAPEMLPPIPVDNSRLINAESCRTWTASSVNSPTVSVARLDVPGKASHEFQKACGDFKDNRLKSAEEHARKAVKIYPQYAAAWVVLGQILHADHKDSEAFDACRQAKVADPDYSPPYICLAGFAAGANDWNDAYTLANHALSLDPATDPYPFLYTAEADYHLKRLDQAELYGLSAEKLDKWNHVPAVHLLLAQIYDAKGDRAGEAHELRKFVKTSPHDPDWEAAKTTLAKIEDRVPIK
ncbi:MAG: tetratricopeptide repeat protein [Candidatus Acidiferrales bacterium]